MRAIINVDNIIAKSSAQAWERKKVRSCMNNDCEMGLRGPLNVYGMVTCLICLLQAPERPVIVFDTLTKDFGSVFEGETLTHVFTFTNTANSTVQIEDIKPT